MIPVTTAAEFAVDTLTRLFEEASTHHIVDHFSERVLGVTMRRLTEMGVPRNSLNYAATLGTVIIFAKGYFDKLEDEAGKRKLMGKVVVLQDELKKNTMEIQEMKDKLNIVYRDSFKDVNKTNQLQDNQDFSEAEADNLVGVYHKLCLAFSEQNVTPNSPQTEVKQDKISNKRLAQSSLQARL